MTSERIQLHSSSGRLVVLLFSVMPLVGLSGVVAAAVVASVRQGAVHLPIAPFIFGAIFLLLVRWALRNSTAVFATAQGLELAKPKRTIPWSSVAEVRFIPFIGGGVMAAHRISFNDDTRPFTFYSQGEPAHVVQRFKAAAQAANPLHEARTPA